MSHPFAAELEIISTALISGMADQEGIAPEHLKINFEDPLSEGSGGVATLRFADWKTENQGVLYVPFVIEEDDTVWKVQCEEGLVSVYARLFVRDMLGRGFPYYVDGRKKVTTYMQYDVIDEGIVFSAQPVDDEQVDLQFGAYDGDTYDRLATIARNQASIAAILELAAKY